MISITTPTYDTEGSVLLRNIEQDNDLKDRSRRITRTATLDGGAEIEDMGMSHGDRTFTIRARRLSRADFDKIAALVDAYPMLIITTDEGAFRGAPERITYSNDITNLTVLIKEKIS